MLKSETFSLLVLHKWKSTGITIAFVAALRAAWILQLLWLEKKKTKLQTHKLNFDLFNNLPLITQLQFQICRNCKLNHKSKAQTNTFVCFGTSSTQSELNQEWVEPGACKSPRFVSSAVQFVQVFCPIEVFGFHFFSFPFFLIHTRDWKSWFVSKLTVMWIRICTQGMDLKLKIPRVPTT